MANSVESETWDTGVYQLETTDPVQGGVDGIDNVPHKALANRTVWLKAQLALKALVGGDNTQIFKAADGLAADDVVNKGQLDTAIAGAGKVLQVASVSNSSEIVSTATIPQDSTIPDITEGVEILSLTFTPKSATSTLYIKVNAYGNEDANEGDNIVFPVFEDSLCIGVGYLEAYGLIYNIDSTFFSIKRQKGDTAQATYSVRAGLDGGTYEHLGTTDYSLGTDYGGLRASTLEIWEVEA